MIKKPQGYDTAAAYTGEVQSLPKGKYVCKIKQVATQQSRNGNLQLVILYDIAEGEYKDFYKNAFDEEKSRNRENARWRGVFKQNMEGKGLPWLKGIITAIEKTNNFVFPWDQENNEQSLKGKQFGGIFRRRQYETQTGNKAFVTELFQIRSKEGLEYAKVPDDELLPDAVQVAATPSPVGDGFMSIPDGANDEGIPFM